MLGHVGQVISWCKVSIAVKVYIYPPVLYIPFLRISIVLFDYRKKKQRKIIGKTV